MDDNDNKNPDDRLMDKLEAVLGPARMSDLICQMLDYQMLMNSYIMEVDPELFRKAREYADDYVGPNFHVYKDLVRDMRG
jgi:hypothetical protein